MQTKNKIDLDKYNYHIYQGQLDGVYLPSNYSLIKYKLALVDLTNAQVYDFDKDEFVTDIKWVSISSGIHLITNLLTKTNSDPNLYLNYLYHLSPNYFDGTKKQLDSLYKAFGKVHVSYEDQKKYLLNEGLFIDNGFKYGEDFTVQYPRENFEKQVETLQKIIDAIDLKIWTDTVYYRDRN